MGLFSRNFAIIAGSLLVLLLLLMVGARVIVLDSFVTIEEKKAREHGERVAAALRNEVAIVDAACSDYSVWDEAYRFVQTGSADFIRINLADATLAKLRIDFISFIRLDGSEVFSKTVASKKGAFSPYKDLNPYLTAGIGLLNQKRGVSGLIFSGGVPIMLSARPVLTSEGKGPAGAVMIMGRMLDAEELTHLTGLIRLPLEIAPYTASSATPAVISLKRPDLDTIHSSYLFKDINGKPAFYLTAKIARDIYRQGAQTVKQFMFAAMAGMCIVLLVVSRLTSRLSDSEWNRLITDTLYEAVIEKSSAVALIMDAETCRIIKATPDAAKFIGYAPERLEGVLFRELLHGGGEQFDTCRSAACEAARSPSAAKVQLMRSDCAIVSATLEATCITRGGQQFLLLYLQQC